MDNLLHDSVENYAEITPQLPGKTRLCRRRAKLAAMLRAELDKPSLYDVALALLKARGFEIPSAVIERDRHAPHEFPPET